MKAQTNSVLLLMLFGCFSFGQPNNNNESISIDTSLFLDSAHHWYDIHDEEKIIEPRGGQKRYKATEIEEIADNILLFQKSNGGWPKNYDMQAILTEEQKLSVQKAKDVLNTTFDNGGTHSQLNYLAEAYSNIKIEKYKNAFLNGIEFVLSAQYENGGWPQFYPDTGDYKKYITFNDGAMIGIMNLLNKIVRRASGFAFIEDSLYDHINAAYSKGIECIINCQIEENEIKTAWCQQHDNSDYHPQSARSFEPAAICNGESAAIVKFLMSIENPNEEIINCVNSAVKWFEDSKIFGTRVEKVKSSKVDYKYHSTEYDVVVITDSEAKPIWTRFYELKTHKPLFCNRDGKVVYSLEEVERERRTGYAWYVYEPQEIIDLYPIWSNKWVRK
jgi:PelA/Pel-15E family pectate lyase